MAKQFDNSFGSFARRSSAYPLTVLSVVVLVCLAAGLAMSLKSGSWSYSLIFSVSITAISIFGYLNFSQSRNARAAKDQKRIEWDTSLPEVQRQSLNLAVFELARILEVEPEQMNDVQSAYIVAEDLALRQIQQEEGAPLMRHVSIAGVPFDAVLVKNDAVVCVEVSFLVAPELHQDRISAMLRKIGAVKNAIGQHETVMKPRLMMALITQLTPEDEDKLRSKLNTNRFSETPVDIDIRLLDFEALQKIYVTD
jgi:hypothetical protein